MADTQVLIIGAGPTGWFLPSGCAASACACASSTRPRSPERRRAPWSCTRGRWSSTGSSAWPRRWSSEGWSSPPPTSGSAAGRAAQVALRRDGQGPQPLPLHADLSRRTQHERLLIEQPRGRGRRRSSARPSCSASRTTAPRAWRASEGPDGAEELCEADYLAGCDGARSAVREVLGAGFPGGTYAHLFYVADVEGSGPVMNGELHVALDDGRLPRRLPAEGDRDARGSSGSAEVPGDGREALDLGGRRQGRARASWASTSSA